MKKRQILRKITAISVMIMMIITTLPISASTIYEGDIVALETEQANADLDIVVTPSATPSVVPSESAASEDEPEASITPTVSVTPAEVEKPVIRRSMGLLSNTVVTPAGWDDVQAAIGAASNGDVIDLSGLDLTAGKTIYISGTMLTLKGNSEKSFLNLSFIIKNSEITIENLDIGKGNAASPLTFEEENTLILKGANNFNGATYGFAGINVEENNILTIEGNGSVTATGGDCGAGIGGGDNKSGGTITINNGNVEANGGYLGAGIGGGYEGAGGTITIKDGTVEATGGDLGAGIGGGYEGAGGTIIIDDGTVEATGGANGAGIGGGPGGDGGTITINNGSVTAIGGEFGAGIGGGAREVGGTITINDGNVTATGGDYGAGIGGGGGNNKSGGTITINDGSVTVIGGQFGAGIGGGWQGAGGEITINSGSITATGGYFGAGIGCGYEGVGGTITIDDGSVTAIGGDYGAGIGGGADESGGEININDGIVEATGGDYGAGIGGGTSGDGGTIIINNGIVTANGGEEGAGIGGGTRGASGTITINDGTVTATGGDYGAGIGGGSNGDGEDVTISGGTVTANGGEEGAGIGGGSYGFGGEITISGGTVEANGGYLGAGIGGGTVDDGGIIAISGGTVTATGGEEGAGIGGGSIGSGGEITISGGTVEATGGEAGAGIGGGTGEYGEGGTVIITGGSIKATKGSEGAENIGHGKGASESGSLTNSENDVFLNILTIEGAGIENIIEVRYGNGIEYGTKGVKSDEEGKLYFYLPATTKEENVKVKTDDGEEYAARYVRQENDSNDEALKPDISDASIKWMQTTYTYTGLPFVPEIEVEYEGEVLKKDRDYTVSVKNGSKNVGEYLAQEITILGIGDYSGEISSENDISITKVQLSIENITIVSKVYDGEKTASVGAADIKGTVNGEKLILGTDYELSAIFKDANIGTDKEVEVAVSLKNTALANSYEMVKNIYEAKGNITKATPVDSLTLGDNRTLKVGEKVTLTPSIDDGQSGKDGWTWDEEYLSATFNSPATFTALKVGKTTVTYTALNGDTASIEITIAEADDKDSEGNKRQPLKRVGVGSINKTPVTGDMTDLRLLLVMAILASGCLTGLIICKKKSSKIYRQ